MAKKKEAEAEVEVAEAVEAEEEQIEAAEVEAEAEVEEEQAEVPIPALIPLEKISELRFSVEGSGTIFYLDETYPPGKFIVRVWKKG